MRRISGLLQFTGLWALSLMLLHPPSYLQGMIFYIFQERDIARAQELLSGSLIFFGPELTGGGNLPGPFYYFLLSPPLLLGLGWMGTWYWMFLLFSLGGVLGWYFFRSKFDTLTAFLWLVMYSLIRPTTHLLQIFVNPSFAILFIVLINIFILKAYSDNSVNKRNRSFIIACLFVGLSIQMHYSSVPYIFALLAIQIFAEKIKVTAISKTAALAGLAVFGFTWIPYLFWLTLRNFGIELGQPLPYGGSATNAVPSLLAHFTTSLGAEPLDQLILTNLKKIFVVMPLIFITFAALKLNFFSKKVEIPESAGSAIDHKGLINILKICLLFTFIPISFYFFVPQGSRYGAPFAISLCFLAVTLFNKIVTESRQLKYFNLIGAFTLVGIFGLTVFLDTDIRKFDYERLLIVFFSLLLIIFFQRNKIKKNKLAIATGFLIAGCLSILQVPIQNKVYSEMHAETNMPRFRHWQRIWSTIYNETGWSYAEAFERVYFVNHQREQATKSSYQIFAQNRISKTTEASGVADGYFVSINKPGKIETLQWLLAQPIQEDIRIGLMNGDIVVGNNKVQNNMLIAPYYVVNKEALPHIFHNAGWGYAKLPEEDLFRKIREPIGAQKVAENSFLFKWNECPGNHRYCDTGMLIDISYEPKNILKITARVLGLPLSQSSKWISPAWTQVWFEPYFEIKCGATVTSTKLASSIGYNQKYLGYDRTYKYPMANNSLLAPFVKTISVRCNEAFSEISAGRESSDVEQIPNLINLPRQRQTIRLL